MHHFARLTVAALLVVGVLVGCATPSAFDFQKWNEEVLLRDGTVILTSRSFVPGEVWYSTNGFPHYRREQVLELPDGHRWQSQVIANKGIISEPLLVDRVDQSWFIVAIASTPQSDELVFSRAIGNSWVTVSRGELPSGLQCNLLTFAQRRGTEDAPLISMLQKRQLIERWKSALTASSNLGSSRRCNSREL